MAHEVVYMISQYENQQTYRFLRCVIFGEVYFVRMAWVRGLRNADEMNIDSEPGVSPGTGRISVESSSLVL